MRIIFNIEHQNKIFNIILKNNTDTGGHWSRDRKYMMKNIN